MKITVNQLSKMAGVSVRTLHYYDEIGLLKPSSVGENGYRYYDNKEALKLQQILFFKELEFSLSQIVKIMQNKNFDTRKALLDQKNLLIVKQKRIDGLLETIDKTLNSLKGGEKMKNDDLYGSFSKGELEKLKEEAKQRWGDSEAYKQSEERTKNWTHKDYQKIAEDGKKLTQEIANVMDRGVADQEVQKLIKKHHQGIEIFYDCSLEMYQGLGNLYIADPRFKAYYEKFAPGLAQFMHEAIDYYCSQQK